MNKARVLIVDDDEHFLERLGERLDGFGFIITRARNGQEALRLAGEKEFDAVALDVQLPDMSGESVLAEMLGRNQELRVIMLTGYANIDQGVRAIRSGAFDYLEKPANIQQLVDRLRAAHEQRLLLMNKSKESWLRGILKRAFQ